MNQPPPAPASGPSHSPGPHRTSIATKQTPPRQPRPALRWPAPQPVTLGFTLALAGLGVWAAATFLGRPGLQWALTAIAAAGLATWAGRATQAGRQAQSSVSAGAARWRTAFGLLAVALLCTLTLRDSGPMQAVVVVAALGVAAFAVAGDPRPRAVILAPVWALVAWVRAFAWWPVVPRSALPQLQGQGPLLRGIGLGAVLVGTVGALLASADRAFSGLIASLLPSWQPDWPLLRLMIGLLVISVVAAVAFCMAAPPPVATSTPRRAHAPAEWLVPVGALIAVLGVFFAVQAAVLFDAYPDALVQGDLTPAERARQGFGQLVCVSVIVAATLTWAGSRAAAGQRRWLLLAGGVLLLQLELLVLSALRRMYLYENTFGWTVLRVQVAWFEVWLGALAIALAVLWLVGSGRHATRIAVYSAGVGVLVLALIGPDLIVARASVERLAVTGQVDTGYLSRLGPDAAPALNTLPEPQRTCALLPAAVRAEQSADQPWYAFNVSRWQARQLVSSTTPSSMPPSC